MFYFIVVVIFVLILNNRTHIRITLLQDQIDTLKKRVRDMGESAPAPLGGVETQHVDAHPHDSLSSSVQPLVSEQVPAPREVHEHAQTDTVPNNQPADSGEMMWATYLARAGIGAILIGVAFFFKLAIDNNWIGEGMRIAIGCLVGLSGLMIGQYLRTTYRTYSNVLIGGGISILYLTVFSAEALYGMFDTATTLGIMIGITALAMIMSMVDKTPQIAHVGIAGGFLVPLLISFDDRIVQLFTYILIIDLGILATSIRQKWNSLYFSAFAGTILLYMVAVFDFADAQRQIFIVFTLLYFLVFFGVSLIRHLYKKDPLTANDTTLITLSSLWYGIAVYNIAHPVSTNYAIMYLAIASVLYGVVAVVSKFIPGIDRAFRSLAISLGILFFSAIVPIYFDGMWISYIWFGEAIVLFVLNRLLLYRSLFGIGILLYTLGILHYAFFDSSRIVHIETFTPLFNQRLLTLLIIIVTSAVLTYISHAIYTTLSKTNGSGTPLQVTAMDTDEIKMVSRVFFVLMNIFVLYMVTTEIQYLFDKNIYETHQTYLSRINSTEMMNQGEDTEVTNTLWNGYYLKERSLNNQKDTAISFAWGLYASLLLVLGLIKKSSPLRIAGLILLFLTIIKVFVTVWSLGGSYRIFSSISIGIFALVCSFLYAKFAKSIHHTIVG